MKRGFVICLVALAGCSTDATGVPVPSGDWGGQNAELVVTDGGATARFKCGASGQIPSPLGLDDSGRFTAAGTYDPRLVQGGPRPATYSGRLSGDELDFTIEVEGSSVGPFVVFLGRPASFDVCNFS